MFPIKKFAIGVISTIMSLIAVNMYGQDTVVIEGYTYETGNRGYLAVVQVFIYDDATDKLLAEVFTDKDGFFTAEVSATKEIRIEVVKDMFESQSMNLTPTTEKKNFVQFRMKRTPGYIFEITMAEKRDDNSTPVDAIKGTLIEVYNNTTGKEELVLSDYLEPEFRVNLHKGNHYTILIRKEGYLAKRMEAFVDVEGCILCFEGIGSVRPGVADNLTEGNNNGVLLANVGMERVYTGKTMEIQNIYYDLDKWNIKPAAKAELNKVVQLMSDNPRLRLELGSHTDSRGEIEYNQVLSEKRAKAAVEYLTSRGIREGSLTYKGYGESEITNKCVDGVKCSEKEHAMNRRTELKVTGFFTESRFKTLAQMKQEEQAEAEVLSGQAGEEQIQLLPGETLEEALIRMKKEKEEKSKLLGGVKKSANIKDAPIIKEVEGGATTEIVENMEVKNKDNLQKEKELMKETRQEHKVRNETMQDTSGQKRNMGGLTIDAPSLDRNADGIMISIYEGQDRLPMTHVAFKTFRHLRHYEHDGNHMYIISEPYESTEVANQYIAANLVSDYPLARVVTFIKGKLQE